MRRARPAPSTPPPQAPVAGRMRRILGRFHHTGVFWIRLHLFGVRILPNRLVGAAIVLFTAFFYIVLGRVRRAVAANLEAVLGPCGPLERRRRTWRVLWNQAWCNTERYERLASGRPFEVEVEGREHWPGTAGKERAEATGLVLVTAHVGAWDVGSFVPGAVESRHVHVVREQEVDERSQDFIENLYEERTASAFTTHFSRDNPTLGAKLLAALRRGEIVGIQGDRPSSTARSVEVELFGRPLALPAGPAALARAAGVPLVPVFCLREGRRRYRLVIRPPVEVPREGDRDRELAAAVRAIAAEVEGAIRRRPYQWFCFRDLWG